MLVVYSLFLYVKSWWYLCLPYNIHHVPDNNKWMDKQVISGPTYRKMDEVSV